MMERYQICAAQFKKKSLIHSLAAHNGEWRGGRWSHVGHPAHQRRRDGQSPVRLGLIMALYASYHLHLQ
ncbi:hypothetical protein IF2G_09586 [Cordyceps javanica]|nr:hypothetical protein IF2G_09586 [Cordyceps javanica]